MKIFRVNDTPVQDLENEIPIEVRFAAQEHSVERQQRLLNTEKELSLGLARLREEFKEEIRQLVGAETVEKHAEQYSKLLARIAEIPKKFPRTRGGEKEEEEHRKLLNKEKHELYHSLGFDTKRGIVIRKKYRESARKILERGLEPDAEMPADADTEEPKPTSNPWKWVFPPYGGQWTHTVQSNGSRGSRWRTLNASAVTGEVSLWNRMELFGADNSDWSRIDIMSEVGFWFRMPAAGLVEVWIRYQDINTDYTGQLWDESDCSDADIQQLSRAYLWTLGSTERYSTIVDYRRGESKGSWAVGGPTYPGQILSKHLFSNKSYATNDWVWVAAGVRDMNYFWVDDMSCRSTMTSRWFVKHVVIRSTGAP
ncbi:MAG TPA: hypothetical protein VMW72_19970 [Sedimentisphaerales bacterium]|nr:hypothetical protein [Sedimentisphaerales bacterium]